MGDPGFGKMLAWLLGHRDLGVRELADLAGLPADELSAVLAGQEPSDSVLRRLAPALGFRTVDLFILAELEVPEDLAPLDVKAAHWAAQIVSYSVRLPAAGRLEVMRAIQSLPQEERTSSFATKPVMPHVAGPGTWVIRMLQYRNLNWTGMARALAFATPTYLSAATYGVIGSGRKELSPRLVTDFAALLGMDAHELAALTGVYLRELPPPPAPEVVDAASLLWEARRLSADQARDVSELARSLGCVAGDPPGS